MDKRKILLAALFAALLAVAFLAPGAARAQGMEIPINAATFPDKTFREYVGNNFNKDGDGTLSPEESAEVTEIDVSNKGIADLTGVGYFTALETLDCSYNLLTALDLSGNKALKTLDCSSQTPELEVPRTDNGWSVDLSQLGWWNKATRVSVDPSDAFQNQTVSWTDGKVNPAVTYNYSTGYDNQFMSVTLTLLPQNVGTWAEVQELIVRDVTAFIDWNNEITVGLPAGSPMPTENEIEITASLHATVSDLKTDDGGKTWTFTVTSEDGKRKQNYTLSILTSYDVNLLVQGEGTVSADSIAWKGKTVTLTATAASGYVFDGWKISPDTVTIANNAFEMPDEPVTVTGVFKPISYPVTLHPCGGTIAAGKDVTSYSYDVGVALPGASDMTRDGYTFAGWYDNEALTGDPVAAITADDEGNKEYWARWLSSSVDLMSVSVDGTTCVIDGIEIGVVLPVGSSLPTNPAKIIVVPADALASVSTPVTQDGGATWTFTVTAQDGTNQTYTLCVSLEESISAPVFTEPDGPQEITVQPGKQAKLTAAATNAITYQWYVNRGDGRGYVAISGATDATYTTGAVTMDNDGYVYYCEAANAYGTVQSPVFTLRVNQPSVLPQTGDNTPVGLWALLLSSLGCLSLLALNRCRKGGDR